MTGILTPTKPAARLVWLESDSALPGTHQAAFDALRGSTQPGNGPVLHLTLGPDPLTEAVTGAGYDTIEARFTGRKSGASQLASFEEFLTEVKPHTVLARRILPELHDALGDLYSDIPRLLFNAGAQTLICEGRAPHPNATHPLAKPEAEWNSLSPWWTTKTAKGAIGILTRGKAA